MASLLTLDKNLEKLTKFWSKETGTKTYVLDDEILRKLGFDADFKACKTDIQLMNLTKKISNETILGKMNVHQYINNTFPQSSMDDKMFNKFYENNRDYGHLTRGHIKLSKVRDLVKKSDVDNIFQQDVVQISPEIFFNTLKFANEMLEKVTGGKVTYGTLYDKVARRQGSTLNYIQRHMIGKLGEIAVIQLLNSKSTTGFKANISFDASKPDSSDIFMLEKSSGRQILQRHPKKSIQVKTAIGLNSVVLKEDKTKVDGSNFQADYYVFVQLLADPLEMVHALLNLISNVFESTGAINMSSILHTISQDKVETSKIDNQITITAKVAGFVDQNRMKSSFYMKDQVCKPLGTLSNDSYCVRVSELDNDFSYLASEIF